MMKHDTTFPTFMRDIRTLSDEAWHEFTATLPQGIDFVAEASVRGLMVGRLRRAVARGEADERMLRKIALDGL